MLTINNENISKFSGVFCILDVWQDMGPTMSFNLKRPDGSWYGYREVEKLASLSGIQLRVKFSLYSNDVLFSQDGNFTCVGWSCHNRCTL